jgi:hypothetical protein
MAEIGILLCTAQPVAAQFLQLGTKLVGTRNSGNAEQGISIALSANAPKATLP